MNWPWLNEAESIRKMDQLGSSDTPFFYLISFDKSKNLVLTQSEYKDLPLYFNFRLLRKDTVKPPSEVDILSYDLPDKKTYQKAFERVQHHIERGDTYLINLSFEVPIRLKGGLLDIYTQAHAKYKVCIEDHFTSFTPEPFLHINQQHAYTFPMKGTIKADHAHAAERILQDEKEKAEHYTIVDLLRNDLSQIGTQTQVNRFRYLSPIRSSRGDLLQVSSEIECLLPDQWNHNIGQLIFKMLPAGSISGAPKKRTVEIIKDVESHERDWYTGIAGVYKDQQLESCVLIRYICKSHSQYYYKSGGGITYLSQWKKEYDEIESKIYIPIG